MFGRYIKKRVELSRNQERLVYWMLIVVQAAFNLLSMRIINVKHFDVLYDIGKIALRYAKDES